MGSEEVTIGLASHWSYHRVDRLWLTPASDQDSTAETCDDQSGGSCQWRHSKFNLRGRNFFPHMEGVRNFGPLAEARRAVENGGGILGATS